MRFSRTGSLNHMKGRWLALISLSLSILMIVLFMAYMDSQDRLETQEKDIEDLNTQYVKLIEERDALLGQLEVMTAKRDAAVKTGADLQESISELTESVLLVEHRQILIDQLLKEQRQVLSEGRLEETLQIKLMNIDDYNLQTHFYLEQGEMEADAKRLAEILSTYVFSDLGIEILGSEEVDGQRILKIHLTETHERNADGYYDSPSWFNHYFQGSTGGMFTSQTLIETFLQRQREDWYDGIYITYQEEFQFDHVEGLLFNTIKR